MALFTVSFTTQVIVKSYNSEGGLLKSARLDKPVKLTALPYPTAMSYSRCDNFKIEPYIMEDRRNKSTFSRDAFAGGDGKKAAGSRKGPINLVMSGSATSRQKANEAAQTGNLAAALNV